MGLQRLPATRVIASTWNTFQPLSAVPRNTEILVPQHEDARRRGASLSTKLKQDSQPQNEPRAGQIVSNEYSGFRSQTTQRQAPRARKVLRRSSSGLGTHSPPPHGLGLRIPADGDQSHFGSRTSLLDQILDRQCFHQASALLVEATGARSAGRDGGAGDHIVFLNPTTFKGCTAADHGPSPKSTGTYRLAAGFFP